MGKLKIENDSNIQEKSIKLIKENVLFNDRRGRKNVFQLKMNWNGAAMRTINKYNSQFKVISSGDSFCVISDLINFMRRFCFSSGFPIGEGAIYFSQKQFDC